MAIGMNPRKKGLFGKPFEVPGTPGIGDGMDQVPTGVDPAPGLGMRDAPQPEKMGLGSRLFGRGWEDKAFALGGIMRGDPSGVYMMQQQKAQEQNALAQQAAEMRKRALDWADWRREYEYKRANPMPVNNDTINDFEWYRGLSEEEKRLYHQMRPQMMQVDNGDGTKTIVPYNPFGMAQPSGGLPQFTEEDWEGAGSNASGNFPG